jgi:hypothetical protein
MDITLEGMIIGAAIIGIIVALINGADHHRPIETIIYHAPIGPGPIGAGCLPIIIIGIIIIAAIGAM